MEVSEETGLTAECDGEIHYFCSEGCRDRFLREKACKLHRTFYDLIIVGGGPAGLTAAVYAATLKIDSFLITKDLGGQAIDSTTVENYMGFDFITGPELADKFRYQLIHSNYIDHLMSEVVKIEIVQGGFEVTTSDLRRRPAGNRTRPQAQPGRHAQHPAKSLLRLHLQHPRDSDCGGSPLPSARGTAEPHDCCRSHDLQFRVRDRECFAAAKNCAIIGPQGDNEL